MKKIGIWGQFGDGGKIADGQAVRTTIITNELRRRYGNESVHTVNTNLWKKSPFKFLLMSIGLLRWSDVFVIAPADNGFKVFVPILDIFNRLYKRRILYVVIGGFLPELLKSKPKYIKMVNRFFASFVQTNNIKKDLEKLGVKNISILSNPKRLNTRKQSDLHVWDDKELRVCVFSRLNKLKGVKEAVEAVKLVNLELGEGMLKLDLYGLIQPGYEEWLEELINKNKSFVTYKGIIDYDKTVESLQSYFAMLFPTYYYGEGFPGNVIDAFNSGLPIIATDWLYNKDVIKDGRNGILVPIKNARALADAILILYKNRQLHYEYAKNCLEDAKLYKPDDVLKDFYSKIDI